VLRLSEIRAVKDSVDEAWRSPVADAMAAVWRIPPGAALWWRSSATHVFVVPGASRRFLRFAPDDSGAATALRAGAALAATFPAADGLSLSRPLATPSGAWTATAATPAGPMVAMMVGEADGRTVEAESLTMRQARRWGAALARFHEAAPAPVTAAPVLTTSDPELAAAVARIRDRLGSLDPAVHRRVTLHGDFELDNLRFANGGVEAFDADETRPGWAAEDIALATRGLRGEEGDPPLPRLYDAFIAGYREIASLSQAELDAVSLHALAHSARRATGLSVLDEGAAPRDPEWQRDLHAAIAEAGSWHRENLLRHAGPAGGGDQRS
jgi:Ser/Thr protein kinase RdoA (MazF antagonist)